MTARSVTRASAAWVFGLATTIFMIAVWGRAVVVDVDGMREAAAPMAQSEAVADLFTSWLDRELVETGVDPITSELVVEELIARSTVDTALGDLVGELVAAAASPGPGGGVVDVASILEPTVPEITGALAAAGMPVDSGQVAGLVAQLDPLVVRTAGSAPFIGPGSSAAGRLGTAAVLAVAVMGVSGWAAIAASRDRTRMVRDLLNRVALGGLTFAILLRAGSWVLDPDLGRAPVAESLSLLARSKWVVPLAVGAAAAGIALLIWALRRSFRRAGEPPSRDEAPTPPEGLRLTRSG